MPSSSSLSPDERDGLLRRFLVASRRGEIVALINGAHLEERPGAVVASELCEAYDAEIGFVVVARPGSTTAELIGRVGLIGEDPATIFADAVCSGALSAAVTVTERGDRPARTGHSEPRAGSPHRGRRPVARRCRPALRPAVRRAWSWRCSRRSPRAPLRRSSASASSGNSCRPTRWRPSHASAVATCTSSTARSQPSSVIAISVSTGLHRGTPEAEAELRQIRAAAESAAELVQQLLAVSRQQASQPVASTSTRSSLSSPAEMPLPLLPQLGSLVDIFRLLGPSDPPADSARARQRHAEPQRAGASGWISVWASWPTTWVSCATTAS